MGMFHSHGKGHNHPPFDREQLRGTKIMRRLADISDRKTRESLERGIDLGLEAAPSVQDRTISTLLARAAAGLRRYQHVPQGGLLREHSRRREVRRRDHRRAVRHGNHVSRRLPVRTAGGEADLGAV